MDVGETADGLEAGPLDGPQMDSNALMSLEGKQYDHELAPVSSAERFRFHVVLNAPTAMIKHPDEIPVTYLNKGQAYAVSILDANPPVPSALTGPVRYRTYIRISFHDETQRSRPASCWQLWKEGRGANEAHQRGGKLQAVEYVDPSSPKEDDKKARVEIEAASFDSFVVIWSPGTSGVAETSVSVRFNFLSTDFSHSKGVKGIPVRLCAKTEVISSGSPHSPVDKPEVCFCKVKLFRDHGAERKLANDILHVKKTIEKLRQQANQVEGTGMKIFGKKNKKEEEISGRPGKVPRHKRTWSMSSASSLGGGRSQEEDTNAKLASLQDMFTSTRAVSVLYLRGSDLDDPDINPVHLPGEAPELADDIWARRRSSVATTNTTASSFVSPTPSSASLSSQHGDGFSSPERREWERGFQPLPPPQQNNIGSEIPIRVKTTNDTGMLSGWIEAIGIDSTYIPPIEKASKAVMSIYILPTALGSPQNGQIYRAVYLQTRTAQCLTSSIAAKCGIDPATVLRTVHMSSRGLSIFVDDEFVREMAEGQDMKVQAVEIREESPFASPPQEWANSPEESQDGEGNLKNGAPHGWELRLLY
ncbi:CP2 transcription factor-domain-containing protein [Morchella snyderi]|nr:CP2 transcription factor-domain-containing protein [Morchella snyderi]